jgi:hypothetical protein
MFTIYDIGYDNIIIEDLCGDENDDAETWL